MAVKRNSKTVKFRYLSSRGFQRDVVHILNFGDLTPHLTYAFEQWMKKLELKRLYSMFVVFLPLTEMCSTSVDSRFLTKQDDLDILQNVRNIRVDSSKIYFTRKTGRCVPPCPPSQHRCSRSLLC
jgi:hypothetical protein